MFTMSTFKVVLSQASKSQKNANEFWLKAWHQACVLAASEHRNLAPLNMLAEAVYKMPGMVVMPLVEAVLAIGGKDEKSGFPGMISVDITKDGGVTTIKFRATKFKGENKERYKNEPLISSGVLASTAVSPWWEFAKPEKVNKPGNFKSVIVSALKKASDDTKCLLTPEEEKLLNAMVDLVIKAKGSEIFG